MKIAFDGIAVRLQEPEKTGASTRRKGYICPVTLRTCNNGGVFCRCEVARLEDAFDELPDLAWAIP
ncbi:MAG: hypothetical protein ACLGHY_12150 [Gammaproteobacteria bacterium]